MQDILDRYNKDKTRLMDILWDVQNARGCISDEAVDEIASGLRMSRSDVRETISFYHFYRTKPTGKYVIYLNSDVAAQMAGYAEVKRAFETHCGCAMGQTDPSGLFTLHDTPCIGMSDREVAALINFIPFTNLTPDKVKGIVDALRQWRDISLVAREFSPEYDTDWNLVQEGKVFNRESARGVGLAALAKMTPEDVASEVEASGLRGRGGAGFPTGMKWGMCRKAKGASHYIICNADEGEPGTFKDRLLLTYFPTLLVEGMVAGGYAIGAREGIIYLRAEYKYMLEGLNRVLAECRNKNLLGKNVLGKAGFDFDIRIQLGCGAYVCGEESALIESLEGKRGQPRVKPPFPSERGYMGQPTAVNNVETLCSVPLILLNGHGWYKSMGTEQTPGAKLLSVSGDCGRKGVFEVPFGITVRAFLELVQAPDAYAVQVSGPSGQCINAQASLDRRLCHEDLSVGGSMIVFGKKRKGDLLKYMRRFMQFFVEESCGICVPCRAGNVALRDLLDRIMEGKGARKDLDEVKRWADIVSSTSRCGLGQSSPRPLMTSLLNFPDLYEDLVPAFRDPLINPSFNLQQAVQEYENVV